MLKIYMKSGDQRPVVEAAVVDGNGDPIDMTGASAKFSLWELEATTPTIADAAATIPNPTGGLVQYIWQSGDTDNDGLFVGEFKVIFADGTELTVPSRGFIEIEIQKSLS